LLYYNARYYDPSLGTFISPDTLVPDPGLVLDYNRYMYVRGNPLRYTDHTGHCIDGASTFACIVFASAVAGGVINSTLYVLNESQQDGFNFSEDWSDLATSFGSGFVAGALVAVPSTTPIGIGMAAAQVGDHAINIMTKEDFSAGEHLVGSVANGASGYVAGPAATLGKTVLTRRVTQGAAVAVTGGAGQVVVDSIDGQATVGSFLGGAMWGALDSAYGNLVEVGTKGLSPNQETVWNGAFNTMWEFFKGGSQWILDPSQHQMQ
jgi:hypothetical protein